MLEKYTKPAATLMTMIALGEVAYMGSKATPNADAAGAKIVHVSEADKNKPPQPPGKEQAAAHLEAQYATLMRPLERAINSGQAVMWDGAVYFHTKNQQSQAPGYRKDVIWQSLEKDKRLRMGGVETPQIFMRPIVIKVEGTTYLVAYKFDQQHPQNNKQLSFHLKNTDPAFGAWEAIDISQAIRQGEVTFHEQANEGGNTIAPVMRKIKRSGNHLTVNDPKSYDWEPVATLMDDTIDTSASGQSVHRLDEIAAGLLKQIPTPEMFK